MILTSPRLGGLTGVRHGFSTRLGGVSDGSFASWNMGPGDDAPERVAENRRRFAVALGLSDAAALVQTDQVHGARVVDASDVAPGTEADAIVTDRPGWAVAVRTADCAPILMTGVDARGRRHVAAVHAGWRGAVADIPGAAVRALAERGVAPDAVDVAVGPTIGLAAFEVGPEVIDAARAALGAPPRTFVNPAGRWHLDLVDLVTRLLRLAGVRSERIEQVGGCTVHDPTHFYSHRRDRGRTGRHLAGIAIAAETAP